MDRLDSLPVLETHSTSPLIISPEIAGSVGDATRQTLEQILQVLSGNDGGFGTCAITTAPADLNIDFTSRIATFSAGGVQLRISGDGSVCADAQSA